VLLHDGHELVQIISEELLVVGCLPQTEKCVVLSSTRAVNLRRTASAENLFSLDADVGCFPLVALEAECSLWQTHTMSLTLAPLMRIFETLEAKKVHAILATHQGCLAFALRANRLFYKHHLGVLSVTS
jgi:hypothetical protein